jgi:hypothetical protein
MGSLGGILFMKFNLRRFFFSCLLLSFLLACLAHFSKIRTQIQISLDGKNAVFSVGSSSVTVPWTETGLASIEVKTRDSAFSMGGENIRIEQNGQSLWQDSLPGIFLFDQKDHCPVGDWWVDYRTGPEKRVFFSKQNLSGPFRLTATFTGRSLHAVRILLNGDERLQFEFRRGLLSNDFGIADARHMLEGSPFTPIPASSLASILEPWLRGAAFACLLAGILTALAAGSGFPGNAPLAAAPALPKKRIEERWILLALVGAAGGLYAWTAASVLERLPHFQDDLCYLARAKWLLAGHWFQPMPFYREVLQSFPFLIFDETRQIILTRYPVVWSAFLAGGELFSAPWIISPIFGALAVGLIVRMGKWAGDPRAGWLAGLLLAASPLMILLSASMLSHAATLFFCMVYAFSLLAGLESRRPDWLALSGLALGIAAGMRPLTALGMLLPGAGLFFYHLLKNRFLNILRFGVVFGAGMAFGLLPFFWDNYSATGHPLQTAYSLIGVQLTLRPEEIPHRLLLADSTLSFVPLHVFGWGWRWCPETLAAGFTCLFVFLPFLLGRWNRHDIFFAAICVSIPLAYGVHAEPGSHAFGPRYYFEVIFAFALLTGRGISVFLAWLRDFAPGSRLSPGVVWTLLGIFWLAAAWNLPGRLALYRGYNDVNGSLEQAVRAVHADTAIVFLENDSYTQWIKAANLLSGDWSKPKILIAASTGKKQTVMRAFPNHPAYLWNQENKLVSVPREKGGGP